MKILPVVERTGKKCSHDMSLAKRGRGQSEKEETTLHSKGKRWAKKKVVKGKGRAKTVLAREREAWAKKDRQREGKKRQVKNGVHKGAIGKKTGGGGKERIS